MEYWSVDSVQTKVKGDSKLTTHKIALQNSCLMFDMKIRNALRKRASL